MSGVINDGSSESQAHKEAGQAQSGSQKHLHQFKTAESPADQSVRAASGWRLRPRSAAGARFCQLQLLDPFCEVILGDFRRHRQGGRDAPSCHAGREPSQGAIRSAMPAPYCSTPSPLRQAAQKFGDNRWVSPR